jgi:hypothetical protein
MVLCKCVLPPGDNPIAVNKYLIIINPAIDLKILSNIGLNFEIQNWIQIKYYSQTQHCSVCHLMTNIVKFGLTVVRNLYSVQNNLTE